MNAVPPCTRRSGLVSLGLLTVAAGGWPALFQARSAAAIKGRKSILVEDTHSGSSITNEYNFGSAEMGRLLTEQGKEVMGTAAVPGFRGATGLTGEILARFDVVIFNALCGNQEIPFADAEVEAIKKWVHAGGGLLVVSAGPKLGTGKTSSILNPVIKPFGLAFHERNLETKRITKLNNQHPILRGLHDFYIIHGAPVNAPAPAENIAWCGEDSVLAVRRINRGRVAVLGGGSAFMGQGINSKIIKHSLPATVAANKLLFTNLVNWLAEKPLEA
jgi:hypothetical protein